MSGNRRSIVLHICVVLVLCLLSGCGREKFDATAYTQAVLALEFQGVTDDARQFEEAASVEDLKLQYLSFVDEVTNLLSADLDLTQDEREEYSKVVAMILNSMRYDVGEAKKNGKNEYVIPITVWPNNTLLLYKELLTRDSLVIAEQIEKGKIKGSKNEINDTVQSMISAHASDLLEKAYSSSDYDEAVTMDVKLTKENEAYVLDGEDMSQLIVKILRFDEAF